MKQLELLELGSLEITEERVALFSEFSFLKELRVVQRPKGYPEALQDKIRALLPKVEIKFQ